MKASLFWISSALLLACMSGLGKSEIQCLPEATGPAGTALREIQAELQACALCAPAYFTSMTARPPDLCIDDSALAPRGAYEPEAHRIVLSLHLSRGEQLLVALHEIRHLDQVALGLCPSPQMAQEAYVTAKLALEADAMANTVGLAWSMRHTNTGTWRAAQSISQYDDITRIFSDRIDEGATMPEAVGSAFAQWYKSGWRVENYRLAACMSQLDQRDAQHLLPLYAPLPEAFFEVLCKLPDGRPYPCEVPDQTPESD
ncbi:DUF6782 family putative metallopeptidase [Tropicimonas sp. S265A]|uniref:DUF6782 family putative metallopeptidase n=1 Tax=Tropicimonas sp. S265A TaxID=3415134 RepID=UPI003C7BC418